MATPPSLSLSLWNDVGTHVADVTHDPHNDLWGLWYAPAWLEQERPFYLAPCLPLAAPEGGYDSRSIRRFIENLLPEGAALDVVARSQGIGKGNIFGLIRALGAETTGAFRFQADGSKPDPQAANAARPISTAELARRIADRDTRPFIEWDGKVRMSVAGYQDKLPVHVEGESVQEGTIFLPDNVPSTHILKPQPRDSAMPHMVVNEHFCMRLAAAMRLPAAEVQMLHVPQPVLAVRRFDRVRQAPQRRVLRTHIIDACQAGDLPVSYKYEHHIGSVGDARLYRDGMSFPRLFGLLEHSVAKAADKLAMIRWALFQILIGNGDAHGKNFSFYVLPQGLATAPWYDLISVAQYPDVSQDLAMAFGDCFALEELTPFEFAHFAHLCAIDRRLLAREAQRMAKAAPVAAAKVLRESPYTPEEHAFAQRIAAYATTQAQRLVDIAQKAAALPSDLF